MSDTHSHTPEIEVPVLIVGAGPAGLVASLSLARHGVGHLTVETAPVDRTHAPGSHYQPAHRRDFASVGRKQAVPRGGHAAANDEQ